MSCVEGPRHQNKLKNTRGRPFFGGPHRYFENFFQFFFGEPDIFLSMSFFWACFCLGGGHQNTRARPVQSSPALWHACVALALCSDRGRSTLRGPLGPQRAHLKITIFGKATAALFVKATAALFLPRLLSGFSQKQPRQTDPIFAAVGVLPRLSLPSRELIFFDLLAVASRHLYWVCMGRVWVGLSS